MGEQNVLVLTERKPGGGAFEGRWTVPGRKGRRGISRCGRDFIHNYSALRDEGIWKVDLAPSRLRYFEKQTTGEFIAIVHWRQAWEWDNDVHCVWPAEAKHLEFLGAGSKAKHDKTRRGGKKEEK